MIVRPLWHLASSVNDADYAHVERLFRRVTRERGVLAPPTVA
jgi:hypothetical protein